MCYVNRSEQTLSSLVITKLTWREVATAGMSGSQLSIAALGKVLRSMGYEHKKITRGASYRIVMRSEEKE